VVRVAGLAKVLRELESGAKSDEKEMVGTLMANIGENCATAESVIADGNENGNENENGNGNGIGQSASLSHLQLMSKVREGLVLLLLLLLLLL
jgi:hypothetical protein